MGPCLEHSPPEGGGEPPEAPAGAVTSQTQEPVTFEDISIYLSRGEWDVTTMGQRELYRRIMLDNYDLLMSLGYPGPKPDILHRLECGEEPWICTPQTTIKWDGPHCSSPGHNGYRSCLEKPSQGRWPDAGGHSVLGERMKPPCQGQRRMPWRLRFSRLLRKLRQEEEEAAASRAAGTGEHQEQMAPSPQPETGPEAEHGGRVEGNEEEAPPEQLHGAPPGLPGESSIILKDHCYYVLGRAWALTLQEHNYCWRGPPGTRPCQYHQYFMPRFCHHRRRHRRAFQAGCWEPTGRRCPARRLVRKDKQSLWHCQPIANSQCPVPAPQPGPQPAQGLLGMFCLRIKLQDLGEMPGGPGDPVVTSEPPAVQAEEEVQTEWGEWANPQHLTQLHNRYNMVVCTVRCMLCQAKQCGSLPVAKGCLSLGINKLSTDVSVCPSIKAPVGEEPGPSIPGQTHQSGLGVEIDHAGGRETRGLLPSPSLPTVTGKGKSIPV